jgi:hypothetical protein
MTLKNFYVTSFPQPPARHLLDGGPLLRPACLFCHIPHAICHLLYKEPRLPKTPTQYTITVKAATEMFAERLNDLQHSKWLIAEN